MEYHLVQRLISFSNQKKVLEKLFVNAFQFFVQVATIIVINAFHLFNFFPIKASLSSNKGNGRLLSLTLTLVNEPCLRETQKNNCRFTSTLHWAEGQKPFH